MSIKINQNININTNIKNFEEKNSSNNQKQKDSKIYKTNKDKGSKTQIEESCDFKFKRTKSCMPNIYIFLFLLVIPPYLTNSE